VGWGDQGREGGKGYFGEAFRQYLSTPCFRVMMAIQRSSTGRERSRKASCAASISLHTPKTRCAKAQTCSKVQYPVCFSHSLSWAEACCTSCCDCELAAWRASRRNWWLSGTGAPIVYGCWRRMSGWEAKVLGVVVVDDRSAGFVEMTGSGG
jgi:hypothetical protein